MMNFNILAALHTQWSLCAIESFAPVYPTSIRGTTDNKRGPPGTR